jgi:hypothetical protein
MTRRYMGGTGVTAREVITRMRESEMELLMCHLQPKTTRQMEGVFRQVYDSVEVRLRVRDVSLRQLCHWLPVFG